MSTHIVLLTKRNADTRMLWPASKKRILDTTK